MFYLVQDVEDKDYLLTEYTDDKRIIDYHDNTPNDSSWQDTLTHSHNLTASQDKATKAFHDWLDSPGITTIATFDSLDDYDQYLEDHPELMI